MTAESALAQKSAQDIGACRGRHYGTEKAARKIPGHDRCKRYAAVGDRALHQPAPVPGLHRASGEHHCQSSTEQGDIDAREMLENLIPTSTAGEPDDDE